MFAPREGPSLFRSGSRVERVSDLQFFIVSGSVSGEQPLGAIPVTPASELERRRRAQEDEDFFRMQQMRGAEEEYEGGLHYEPEAYVEYQIREVLSSQSREALLPHDLTRFFSLSNSPGGGRLARRRGGDWSTSAQQRGTNLRRPRPRSSLPSKPTNPSFFADKIVRHNISGRFPQLEVESLRSGLSLCERPRRSVGPAASLTPSEFASAQLLQVHL